MAFGAHDEFTLREPVPDAHHRGAADFSLQESPLGLPWDLASPVVSGLRLTLRLLGTSRRRHATK
jgi:hypothetical protein